MRDFFSLESPVMGFLSKMTDLIWINILMLVCCIPIFTIGASVTAMYYVTIKMVNKEDGYITRSFFKAFKQNFKQSTILWLIMLVVIGLFAVDFRIILFSDMSFPKAVTVILVIFAVLITLAFSYVFPYLSRFENTTKKIILNSAILSYSYLPKTILIVLLSVLPVVVGYVYWLVTPGVILIGFSLMAYINSYIFMSIFKKFEDREEVQSQVEVEEEIQEETK